MQAKDVNWNSVFLSSLSKSSVSKGKQIKTGKDRLSHLNLHPPSLKIKTQDGNNNNKQNLKPEIFYTVHNNIFVNLFLFYSTKVGEEPCNPQRGPSGMAQKGRAQPILQCLGDVSCSQMPLSCSS